MGALCGRRLAQALGVLWAAYTVTFVVLYPLPGDPVSLMYGAESTRRHARAAGANCVPSTASTSRCRSSTSASSAGPCRATSARRW